MKRQRNAGRTAFTLIELLVVIAIIAVLVGMGVLVVPSLIKSEHASRGAQTLQGSLFIAKQQAPRDRIPYGIRLLPDANLFARSFRYIQQPDDFTGGLVTVEPALNTAVLTKDPTGGLRDPVTGLPTPENTWPVQSGDFLQVQSEQPVRINAIDPLTFRLTLNRPMPAAVGPTSDYRIMRRPRPVAGEEIIEFPEDVAVDLNTSRSIIAAEPGPPGPAPAFAPTYTYDILFAPAGTVLGQAGVDGKIILWVRDLTQNPSTTDDQSLMVIYTRSGRIASYPVDVGSANPYSFPQQSPRGAGQ